jgi:hypothetical protein
LLVVPFFLSSVIQIYDLILIFYYAYDYDYACLCFEQEQGLKMKRPFPWEDEVDLRVSAAWKDSIGNGILPIPETEDFNSLGISISFSFSY